MSDLKCPGVGRDAQNDQSLCFYFNRPVTDDEMRFFHKVLQRTVAVMPAAKQSDLRVIADSGIELCEDCPPVGYPTDGTRCAQCPRRPKGNR